MSDDADYLKDLRAAMTRTAALHLRNVENLNAVLWGGRAPASREAQDVEARLYDVLFDAARLHLSVYNHLLTLSGNYADYYVEGLRRLTRTPLSPLTPAERRQIFETSGALGEEVTIRFTLDHQLATREEIALAVSDFRPSNGGDAIPASVKCEILPDRVPAPGERRSVRVTIRLTHPFVAGRRYGATVRVIARDRVIDCVPIEVEVTQPGVRM